MRFRTYVNLEVLLSWQNTELHAGIVSHDERFDAATTLAVSSRFAYTSGAGLGH